MLKSADPAPFAPLFYHPPTTYNLQKILSIALPALGIAAMFALFAAVVYRKNGQLGVTPVTANAWGMGIGALVLFWVIVLLHQVFWLDQLVLGGTLLSIL